MVRDVMKARCTRCYINVDVTAGEALIITLVVNRELAREASERKMIGSRRRKEKESGMRRAEFRERARNYQARGKDVEASAKTTLLACRWPRRRCIRTFSCGSYGKNHSLPRFRQERMRDSFPLIMLSNDLDRKCETSVIR